MIIYFVNPSLRKEEELRTVGNVWGGHDNNLFINAVNNNGKEGTYCTTEVYFKVPLRIRN